MFCGEVVGEEQKAHCRIENAESQKTTVSFIHLHQFGFVVRFDRAEVFQKVRLVRPLPYQVSQTNIRESALSHCSGLAISWSYR